MIIAKIDSHLKLDAKYILSWNIDLSKICNLGKAVLFLCLKQGWFLKLLIFVSVTLALYPMRSWLALWSKWSAELHPLVLPGSAHHEFESYICPNFNPHFVSTIPEVGGLSRSFKLQICINNQSGIKLLKHLLFHTVFRSRQIWIGHCLSLRIDCILGAHLGLNWKSNVETVRVRVSLSHFTTTLCVWWSG